MEARHISVKNCCQLAHEVTLNPAFAFSEPDGRLFPASPLYKHVQQKILTEFWAQFGLESRFYGAECYHKVAVALRIIKAKMTYMLKQQNQRKPRIEQVLDFEAIEDRVLDCLFVPSTELPPIIDALLGAILDYHTKPPPDTTTTIEDPRIRTPERDPVFGAELILKAAEAKDEKLSMHAHFRVIYDLIVLVTMHDRNCKLRQLLSDGNGPFAPTKVVRYIQGFFTDATSFDRTRAWLYRASKFCAGDFNDIYIEGVMSLVEDAPGLLLIWPETFLYDIRRFLALFNALKKQAPADAAACKARLRAKLGHLLAVAAAYEYGDFLEHSEEEEAFEELPENVICRVIHLNLRVHGRRYLSMFAAGSAAAD